MKYAIRGTEAGHTYFLTDRGFFYDEIQRAALFDTPQQAAAALDHRHKNTRYGSPAVYKPQLIQVEEIDGGVKRTVVEMAGTVDLTGLKFTIYYPGIDSYMGTYRYGPYAGSYNRAAELDGNPSYPMVVASSIGELLDHVKRSGMSGIAARVVGIRVEVVKAERRVVELLPQF